MKNFAYIILICSCFVSVLWQNVLIAQTTNPFTQLGTKVLDANTKKPLVFANINIENSNISTVTNNDGEFILKIPNNLLDGILVISHRGYEKKTLKITSLKNLKKISLLPAYTELGEISINATNIDAKSLVLETLKKKTTIYNNNKTVMTAFYRETIKRRKKNASISEAVVKIYKQPYDNQRKDHIELIKARKKSDYKRLDTLALKLQGGPFSNIYTDIIKYPEFIFTQSEIPLYDFSYGPSTQIDKNLVYVVNFKQKDNVEIPLYYGKLYIDANTLALTNAVYSLNVSNRALSSKMYVRKKPLRAEVYPTEATYRVNYRTKNGRWHYAYSNISLAFKVNWKGKLFNNSYTLSSEMAITDWEVHSPTLSKVTNQVLRPTTILSEKASGFSDPRFWGAYNIIEPEKSIESAIKKIQKQLLKQS